MAKRDPVDGDDGVAGAAEDAVKDVEDGVESVAGAAEDAVAGVEDGVDGIAGASEDAIEDMEKLVDPVNNPVRKALLPSRDRDPRVGCPSIRPLDMDNFSVKEYTRASWYVQQQQTLQYQKIYQLRCVVATYDYNEVSFRATGFVGPVLDVHNYYLGGSRSIDKETGKPISTLCAAAIKKNYTAWLSVAPCFLNTWFFGGDYWVIKVGIDENYGTYDWAIVSGGMPREKYADGCTTKSGDKAYQNAGLWIFSRKQVMDPYQLVEARTWLKEQGYTLSQLWPVQQGRAFCGDYPGAYIRTDDY